MVNDIVFELFPKIENLKNASSTKIVTEMKNAFEIRLQRRKLRQKHFLEFENDPNSFSGHTFGFFFVKIRRVR